MPRPSFPRTLRQFQIQFANEEACQEYLAACRWPEGYKCPFIPMASKALLACKSSASSTSLALSRGDPN